METRASYILVGSFVLALLASLFGFTVWIAKIQLEEKRDVYYVQFSGSVTGLQQGSPVRYRGLPVGTVTDVRLDPDNVTRVRTTIQVQEGTPIKTDSIASLEVQGLTGGAYVQISGGTAMSERLKGSTSGIPVIPSRPSTLAEVVDAAPQLLARVVEVTEKVAGLLGPENQAAITGTLANVKSMSDELARASVGLDGTVQQARATLAAVAGLATTLDGATADLGPTMAQARQTLGTLDGSVKTLTDSLRQATTQLTGFVTENREPVRDFTATGLYELTLLITQLRDLSGQLSRVITRIENDPSNFLFGGTNQGVQVRGR